MRLQMADRPPGKGLNTRTSTFGCCSEMHEVPVLARGVQIVHQHAHAHAAVRGVADVLQQGARGLVLADDVILDVERALGMIGERDQAVEGLIARGQQPDAGEVARLALLALRRRCVRASVSCGSSRASLGCFLTCCGRLAHPARTESARASQVLRMTR